MSLIDNWSLEQLHEKRAKASLRIASVQGPCELNTYAPVSIE